jgi:hypothetical protein
VEILKGQNERKGNERLIWSGLNFGFHWSEMDKIYLSFDWVSRLSLPI